MEHETRIDVPDSVSKEVRYSNSSSSGDSLHDPSQLDLTGKINLIPQRKFQSFPLPCFSEPFEFPTDVMSQPLVEKKKMKNRIRFHSIGDSGIEDSAMMSHFTRAQSISGMESSDAFTYEVDGTPLLHVREGRSGVLLALTDDGGLFVAQSSPTIGGSRLSQEFTDRDAEYFQVVPEVENNGGHLDRLLEFFEEVQDGLVTREELHKALTRSAKTNRVVLKKGVLEDLVDLIIEEAKTNENGQIAVKDLAMVLYGPDAGVPDSGNLNLMATRRYRNTSRSTLSIQHTKSKSKEAPQVQMSVCPPQGADFTESLVCPRRCRQEAVFFIFNNWKTVIAILLWLAVNVTLLVCRFFYIRGSESYKVMGDWLAVAKAGSVLVKFNAGLLLFVVCRWTMTLLRGTFLRYFIPFDDYLLFHKLAVSAIMSGALVHSVAITCGAFVKIVRAPYQNYLDHLGHLYGTKQPDYYDLLKSFNSITGFSLWAILITMCTFSMQSSRKFLASHKLTKRLSTFDAFWWCHLCMFPTFFLLIIFHGSHKKFPRFPDSDNWMYIAGPLCIYVLEKVQKMLFAKIKHRAMDVIQVEILPGNVLCLHLSNPPFKFQSGMYVFVQCPGVSRMEWHPFSITSSPSDFEITIHIRAVGDWTCAMLDYWKQQKVTGESLGMVNPKGELIYFPKNDRPITKFCFPRVLIDGPHGAPAQDYERFEVIMLVGAGIGVTPMASIVRDVLHKSKHRKKYPRFNVEKVQFYWTTREQESFEWFRDLMSQAAEEDKDGVVEMHNYLTCMYGDDDPRSFLLKAVRDKFHSRTGHDIIANTKTKIATHFARPNWDAIFSKIANQFPSTTVGVFFCGPSALQMELQKYCRFYTLERKKGTLFVFHHENF